MAAALEPGPDPDAPQALGSRSETSNAPVLGRRAYLPYAPHESPDSCVQRRRGDPRQPARRVGGTDALRPLRAAGVIVRPRSKGAGESDRRGRARVESVCRSEVASARVESVRLYRSRSAWTEGASEALVASIPPARNRYPERGRRRSGSQRRGAATRIVDVIIVIIGHRVPGQARVQKPRARDRGSITRAAQAGLAKSSSRTPSRGCDGHPRQRTCDPTTRTGCCRRPYARI